MNSDQPASKLQKILLNPLELLGELRDLYIPNGFCPSVLDLANRVYPLLIKTYDEISGPSKNPDEGGGQPLVHRGRTSRTLWEIKALDVLAEARFAIGNLLSTKAPKDPWVAERLREACRQLTVLTTLDFFDEEFVGMINAFVRMMKLHQGPAVIEQAGAIRYKVASIHRLISYRVTVRGPHWHASKSDVYNETRVRDILPLSGICEGIIRILDEFNKRRKADDRSCEQLHRLAGELRSYLQARDQEREEVGKSDPPQALEGTEPGDSKQNANGGDDRPATETKYSPGQAEESLAMKTRTLNKHAKDIGVPTPGRGQRNFCYPERDLIKIAESLKSHSEKKIRDRADSLLKLLGGGGPK